MKPSDLELIAKKFGVSPGVRKCNQAGPVGPPASEPKCDSGKSLELPPRREEASHTGSEKGFRVRFTIYAQRPCDWDNYHIKELQDVLVAIGLLDDDNFKIIKSGEIIPIKVSAKVMQRTEIEIIPI